MRISSRKIAYLSALSALLLASTSTSLVALAAEPNVCAIDLEVVTDATIRQTALQDGIDNATCDIIELSGSDTVSLDSVLTVDSSQIAGTSARDVTIRSAEGSVVTMDATRSNDLIDVLQSTDTLRLDGISVTGASSGAVFASGDVYVSNSRFEGNQNPTDGGALHVLGDLDLAGTNYFVNNSSGAYGGAILVEGTGGITGTSTGIFESNNAVGGGGSVMAPFGPVNFASLTISNSISDSDGGGILAESISVTGHLEASAVSSVSGQGGLLYSYYDIALGSLSVSSFSAEGDGGAVYSGGSLTIAGAFDASSGGSSTGSGGALFSVQNMSLGSVEVSSIMAESSGGAIFSNGSLNIMGALNSSSTIASSGSGGAVAAVGTVSIGSVDVRSAIAGGDGSIASIAANVEIQGDASFLNSISFGSGGGISAVSSVLIEGDLSASGLNASYSGGVVNSFSSSVTIEGSTSISNTISGGSGGAIRAVGPVSIAGGTFENITASTNGGCIQSESSSVTSTGTLTMKNCSAQNGNGGAIGATGDVTLAGGEFSYNQASESGGAISTVNGSVTISGQADFLSNSANNLNGGAISAIDNVVLGGATFELNTAGTEGGAVFSASGSFSSTGPVVAHQNISVGNGGAISAITGMSFTSAIFSENQSEGAGGALFSAAGNVVATELATFNRNLSYLYGGAIYSQQGDVTLVDASFDLNFAQYGGGALVSANLTLTGSASFTQNTTSGSSGAILAESLTAEDLVLTDNLANSFAGAAYVNDLTVSGHLELRNNSAMNREAGGIYSNGDVILNTAQVEGNSAFAIGGAIFASGDVVVSGESSFVANSSTEGYAGAIFAVGSVDVAKTRFERNTAAGGGGAIYSYDSVSVADGSVFTDNRALLDGGAVYALGAVEVSDAIWNLNSSEGYGGAIFSSSTVRSINSSFHANSAVGEGGAIHSELDAEILNSMFTANSVGPNSGGGAVSAVGRVMSALSTFKDNLAESGTQIVAYDAVLLGNVLDSADDEQVVLTDALVDLGANFLSGASDLTFGLKSELELGTGIRVGDATLHEESGRYLAKPSSSSPVRSAVTEELIDAFAIDGALSEDFKALFGGDSPEYTTDLLGNARTGTFDSGALQYQAAAPSFAAPYRGPILIVPKNLAPITPGQTVVLEGSNLIGVSEVTIGGEDSQVKVLSDSLLEITVPYVAPGDYSLMVTSSFGQLSVFPEVTVAALEIANKELVVIVKRISETEAKIWAKNVVDAGKVQFVVNEREIAWIRTSDQSNPRLRFANDSYYFVRTIDLGSGKNALEIYVDGERVRRVAYSN